MFKYLSRLFIAGGIVLSVFSCTKKDNETVNPTPTTPPPAQETCIPRSDAKAGTIIQGQYIVTVKDHPTRSADNRIASMEHNYGMRRERELSFVRGRHKAFAAKLDETTVHKLQQDPDVMFVESDQYISVAADNPCQQSLSTQVTPWGVARVGNADGTGKTAWIIDTGIDLDHPDLNVDMTRSKSWITGKSPDDDHGHGTHVAGTIAALDNRIGVVGVAPNAKVVALKVMDSNGSGSMSNIIQAVNHVINYGNAGDVVNMSLGGGTSTLLDSLVKVGAKKGLLFSIAAGNSSADASTSSPGRVNDADIFTVSAMDSVDNFAYFSNYGTAVDCAAPGVHVLSTLKDGQYGYSSGTSMAAPHVAGLLLLKGKNICADGYVKNDPDGKPDPIAHR